MSTNVPFDRAAVREAVRQRIAEVLSKKKAKVGLEQIVEGVSLTMQLGIDSLDILQLATQVEKDYGLRIPEEELRKMDDLGAVVAVVEKHWPGAK